jgi:hypothetical protein
VVLVPLFSEIFGYKDLKNLNTPQAKLSGHLRDETARVAFHITASTNNRKIKETLPSPLYRGKHGTGIVACMRKYDLNDSLLAAATRNRID